MVPSQLRRAVESFWFLPAVLGVAAVGLAEGLLLVDRTWAEQFSDGNGPWFVQGLSPSGSRALLTTVGGSMLGVAATSFSITVSVLATTSSTYGPRLVRNFMADRGNQLVLGALTASFVYCVVVLRAVRTADDGSDVFVPAISVNAGMLVAAVDVAVLVYFIHHIAASVQVTTLQERAGRELLASLDECFPEDDRPRTTRDAAVVEPGEQACHHPLLAPRTGWVTGLRLATLVRRAAAHDLVVVVTARPGQHRVRGELLALLSAPADEKTAQRLASCFEVGPARTPHQDVGFALQQLTEMAVRGLASGSNDPYTAIGATEVLGAASTVLVERPDPAPGHLDADGDLRVVARAPSHVELLSPVFADLRTYGGDQVSVVVSVLGLGERVLRASHDEYLDAEVRRWLEELVASFEQGEPLDVDRELVRARWHRAAHLEV